MAQLPDDFRVLPRKEIDPHTLGEPVQPLEAPPRDEWPTYHYEQGSDRWDPDNLPGRLDGEDYRTWLRRMYAHAVYWAGLDAQQQTQAQVSERPRGRPSLYPALPGETPAERKARLNREAQARWRATHKPGKRASYAPELRAIYDEWEALREQINALTIRATELKARLDKGAG